VDETGRAGNKGIFDAFISSRDQKEDGHSSAILDATFTKIEFPSSKTSQRKEYCSG